MEDPAKQQSRRLSTQNRTAKESTSVAMITRPLAVAHLLPIPPKSSPKHIVSQANTHRWQLLLYDTSLRRTSSTFKT